MSVKFKTKKGRTMMLNREEFVTLFKILHERAQARKAFDEDRAAEKTAKKGGITRVKGG
jgi:hypothetical protein